MTDEQTVDQAAQQAAQKAAQQVADQTAQAASQAARQASADTVRQVIDSSRTAASQQIGGEREAETGSDEFWKAHAQVTGLNDKRTYDEYQHESLESIRRNRTMVDRMAGLSVDYDVQMRNLNVQATQNAVETANMLAKQAVAHRDIAIDREWNVDEVAQAVAKTAVFSDAIAAGVAAAVAASVSKS